MKQDDLSTKNKQQKDIFFVFKSGYVFRKNKSMKQKDAEKGIVGY